MSVRNFWTVFLKMLGVWLVVGGFTTLTQFISAFSFLANGNGNWWSATYLIGLLLLTIAVYIFVLWLFVFKTSWLIDTLKLEQGFAEEKIEFKIQTSSILTIATIVIGGLVLVDSFPLFCRQVFYFIQQKNQFMEYPSFDLIVLHFVKSLVGYLLMTNSKVVVGFIEKQEKGKE